MTPMHSTRAPDSAGVQRPLTASAPVADGSLLQAAAGVRALTQEGDALAKAGSLEAAADKYRDALMVCHQAEAHLAGLAINAWQMQVGLLRDRVAALPPPQPPVAPTPPDMPPAVAVAAPMLLDDPKSNFDYRKACYQECMMYVRDLGMRGTACADQEPCRARRLFEEASDLLNWWSVARFENLGEEARGTLREAAKRFAVLAFNLV